MNSRWPPCIFEVSLSVTLWWIFCSNMAIKVLKFCKNIFKGGDFLRIIDISKCTAISKITVFIDQSVDIVSIKQWGIYILVVHYHNEAPEPIITQLLCVLVWSELISPRETTTVPTHSCYFCMFFFLSLFLVNT